MPTQANSKQAQRALAVVAAAEQLRSGLTALQSIAFQTSLDGITLTSVDLATVLAPKGGAGVLTAPTLGYTSGAALDLVVAASTRAASLLATPVTGTETPIGAAIAAVCGS